MLYHNLNKVEQKLYNHIYKVTIDASNIQALVHFTTMPTNVSEITTRIVKVSKAIVDDYNI